MKILSLFIFLPAFVFAQNEVKELKPSRTLYLNFNSEDEVRFAKDLKAFDVVAKKVNDGTKLEDLSKEELRVWTEMDETIDSYWDIIGNDCSWYCGGGPDTVTASSELKSQGTNTYAASNAHDLNYKTAWVEGAAGNGIGQFLKYDFAPESPRITDIIVVNGYVKSAKAYLDNSRVKKLKVYLNDKPFAILELEDFRARQIFTFPAIGNSNRKDSKALRAMPPWTLKFEILEVYKGANYDDVAITEIYFDGLDVH